MVDEWCAGSGGKPVSLTIVPLWDQARVLREPDRVDPIRPRTGRRRVAPVPGARLAPEVVHKLVRQNAIDMLGLDL